MRAIYFERNTMSTNTISTFRVDAGSYVRGIYIPDENVILYKEQSGKFGEQVSSFTDKQDILDEVRPLLKGIAPNIGDIIYSGIKDIEYDEAKLKKLIQNAKLERKLRDKVETGIDALLEELK